MQFVAEVALSASLLLLTVAYQQPGVVGFQDVTRGERNRRRNPLLPVEPVRAVGRLDPFQAPAVLRWPEVGLGRSQLGVPGE